MNKGHSNPRYKTALCKKYMQNQSCPYGDKCQFAHGEQELRSFNAQPQNMMYSLGMNPKNQNNMLNYKIVKCKNFEKDGTCKYGQHCTFAHGDKEVRNKSENILQMNNPMMIMPFAYPMDGNFQMMMPPQGIDMSQMQQMPMMQNPQYVMMNMMTPGNNPGNNNNDNGEQKAENNQQ